MTRQRRASSVRNMRVAQAGRAVHAAGPSDAGAAVSSIARADPADLNAVLPGGCRLHWRRLRVTRQASLASSVTERHGDALSYRFTGKVSGDTMSGSLDMGEYRAATWIARRPETNRPG